MHVYIMEITPEKIKSIHRFIEDNKDKLSSTHLRYVFPIITNGKFEKLEVIL